MDDLLLWILVGVVVLLALIPMLFGLLLSPFQQATRVELIKAPIDRVWEAISELSRQTEWRDDLKSVQLKDDDNGLRWIEQPTRGSKLTVRKMKEVEQKEILIQMERGKKVLGTRLAILRQVPGGTRVTFTETAEVRSPLRRLFTHLGGKLDKRLNHYISNLKAAFNK